MARYILKRVLRSMITMLIIIMVVFSLVTVSISSPVIGWIQSVGREEAVDEARPEEVPPVR